MIVSAATLADAAKACRNSYEAGLAGRLSTVTNGNSERLGKASGLPRRLLTLLVGLLATVALIASGAPSTAAQTRVGSQPQNLILTVGAQTVAAPKGVGADALPQLRLVSATGVAADAEVAVGSAARVCVPGNSFTADTPVILADGKQEPISKVKVGDKVLATDPETGQTRAELVEQLIRYSGKHAMVLVILDYGSVLNSTDGHPIWDATTGRFTDASKLRVGDKIETTHGHLIIVSGLTGYTADLTAYNLQISTIHTYYAGATPVLVHNSCRRPTVATRQAADNAATDSNGAVRCQYCDEPVVPRGGSPVSKEYDHQVPYSQGGSRDSDNIVVACRTCNRQKGGRTPEEWGGP